MQQKQNQRIGIEQRRLIRRVLRQEMQDKLNGLWQAYGKEERRHLKAWRDLSNAYPVPSPGGRLKKILNSVDYNPDIENQ